MAVQKKKKSKPPEEEETTTTTASFSPDDIAYCKIHPGIGVARVGNSPDEFFIGPETPGQTQHPVGGYKDDQGRIKRQAARFRIYAYNAAGEAIAELTADNARINWNVQLANKKASYRIFLGRYWEIQYPDVKKYGDKHFKGIPPMRNQEISVFDPEQRAQFLDIRPGPVSIAGKNEGGDKYSMTGSFGPLKYTVVTKENKKALEGSRSGYMNVPFIDPSQPELTEQFKKTAKKYHWEPGKMQEPVAESGVAQVYLGELRTDKHGRLLVLGGRGDSRSLIPDNEIGYLNADDYFGSNDYWYDDVSDGVVSADVTLLGDDNRRIEVREKSWLLVAPPKFAPFLETLTTLADQSDQVAQRKGEIPVQTKVSFTNDVYPILYRLHGYQWVNQFALQQHGSGMVFDPLSVGPNTANIFPQLHLKTGTDGQKKANAAMRLHVFNRMRKPLAVLKKEHPRLSEEELLSSQWANEQSGMSKMPQMWGDGGDGLDPVGSVTGDPADQTNPGQGIPGGTYITWATLTERQYHAMKLWTAGDFVDDWPNDSDGKPRSPLNPPKGKPTDKLPVAEQPAALDRASMLPCVGAPFYPGIEITYICEHPELWAEPGRLQWRPQLPPGETLEPGDITRHMALPWQADFSECNHRWWPAARPDNIVTEAQYEEVVKTYDATLDGSLAGALAARSDWARGIPQVSPELDRNMVEHWSMFGFILPRELHGETVYVEQERDPYAGCSERDAFYYLMNIASYPDFEPHARLMVDQYLAQARQNAMDPNTISGSGMTGWNYFQYTPEAFDARMQDIYNQYVLNNSTTPYLTTTTYEQLRYQQIQMGPFNQLDGAWIRGAAPPGEVDQVRNLLFHIYMDELGDAIDAHNHANVYVDELHSLNFYPYPIASWDYAHDTRLLDSAYTEAVFLLAISTFTEDYLPEILGMTLYLEWSSVGLAISVTELEAAGIDPTYYRLHVGIDNASAGHGALAKQAVELFLDQVRQQGGDEAMQEAFERIWTGYVAFGTLGSLGQDISDHFQAIGQAQDWDDYREQTLNAMVDMINSKAQYARQNHGTKKLGPNYLNDWFDDPIGLLDELVASGFITPGEPDTSPIFQLMAFNGPMFHVFTPAEQKLWRDYIISLGPAPEIPTINLEQAMLFVVDKLRQRQSGTSGHHARLRGVDPRSGETVTEEIAWWFAQEFGPTQAENDFVFLRALREPYNGWIVPGNAYASPLLTKMLAGNNAMAAAFREYVPDKVDIPKVLLQPGQTGPYTYKQILAFWVNDGCPVKGMIEPGLKVQRQAAAKALAAVRGKTLPAAALAALAAPEPPAKPAAPRRRYGMPRVH